jgi:hypothetical protein
MAQAYEAYCETSFVLEMITRSVPVDRTPGTGGHKEKRPDFVHHHASGDLYFELKALEIAEPLSRHKEIANKALENAADLDLRARKPGVHRGEPLVISGHKENTGVVERIDATIEKIKNNIKHDQIHYGPTVLVVDLGRLSGIPQGPSGLLPVFFHDSPPAESSVSGELWHIALGQPGEQIFQLPEFDGASNLAGHQTQTGLLREYPGLVAISFMIPRWGQSPNLFTIWNKGADLSDLKSPCTLTELELGDVLEKFSDGLNDERNELGFKYRVVPLRP